MLKTIERVIAQPYWVVALILGAMLIALPVVDIDKDYHFSSHAPTTIIPIAIGVALVAISMAAFGIHVWWQGRPADIGAGIDLTPVKDEHGVLSTAVGECEIRVIAGRIEQVEAKSAVVALPCSEYFDDDCAKDSGSALGAYVSCKFEGQSNAFIALAQEACRQQLGDSEKKPGMRALSFGAGRCILISNPLGKSLRLALVSTTTHRDQEGHSGRLLFLFSGMRELAARLADARVSELVMPIFGGGHARIYPPLALVGLLLAIAEVARYGPTGHRFKKVTVVVFRRDANSAPEVDFVVVRRALALIADHKKAA